ncbi:MAG: hypothetical protein WAO19_07725, partial [Candidatus Kryptoniota bacterium]
MKSSFFLGATLFFLLASNTFAQVHAYVQMDFSGPVEFLVTDAQGERSGYIPGQSAYYQEIPYAGYGDGSDEGSREFGFRGALTDTSFSTTYTIRLYGTGSGEFTGDGGGRQTRSGKGGGFHVAGVIDSNQIETFVFSYSTDSMVTPTFMKIITPQIIQQDLDNCIKLQLLNDTQLCTSLGNALTSFEQYLAKADSISARQELVLFQQTLDSKSIDTIDTIPAQGTISLDAQNILNADAQTLINSLPKPVQFVGELDSLSANLTTAYSNRWVGDTTFVNSLSRQLSNVGKNLQNGNAAKAAAQLENFLNRIEKVFNNTLKQQQNGKPLSKNFVTQDGYNLLAANISQLLTNLGAIGKVIGVPQQFTTIQAAVNASQLGTTILVDSGTYNEVVNIASKDSLTLL